MTKVEEHLAAVRRRCREAQEFAALADAYTHEQLDRNILLVIKGNVEEIRVAANSAQKELDEIRFYLGLPEE